jgi:hypothetical protein
MNLLVALSAGGQCLPTARCHPFDPKRFLGLAGFVQVSKFADVMDFAAIRCST